jgi:hypothetical protein
MILRDKYAIVGIGSTPQGAVPERTSLSFHLEACANAIEDAGVPKADRGYRAGQSVLRRSSGDPFGRTDRRKKGVAAFSNRTWAVMVALL